MRHRGALELGDMGEVHFVPGAALDQSPLDREAATAGGGALTVARLREDGSAEATRPAPARSRI